MIQANFSNALRVTSSNRGKPAIWFSLDVFFGFALCLFVVEQSTNQ
jgi:hypothetical protein